MNDAQLRADLSAMADQYEQANGVRPTAVLTKNRHARRVARRAGFRALVLPIWLPGALNVAVTRLTARKDRWLAGALGHAESSEDYWP